MLLRPAGSIRRLKWPVIHGSGGCRSADQGPASALTLRTVRSIPGPPPIAQRYAATRPVVAGDYVIDEEVGSGIVMAGFPPEEHIAVVYRVRDGLIDDVVLLM